MTLQVRARWRRDAFELDVDCRLPLEGVTALFGRSGCGKTSLLRVIAGLERLRGAEVRLGDLVWQHDRQFVPLHRRRIGLVFQEHSLLPHLSVRDNLLYGYTRTPAAERRLHLDEVAAMLGIDPQRVGIKATTTEQMGFTGRKEGLAALASATVLLPA